jgi:chromate transport protein ChrA
VNDPHEPVLRPRSRAWLLGWLSLVGPVGVVASVALAWLLHQPQLLVAGVLCSALSIVTCVLGVVAVVRGIRDSRRHTAERPRLIGAGISIGAVGAVTSGAVAVAVGLILLALSQYDPY